MNKLKSALGGIVITSTVLIAGCGGLLDTKPNKPSRISVEGIDIKSDAKGNITASRKGVPFTPCKDDCNIFSAHVEIDSIKPRRLGASAVTVVEYQVPLVNRQASKTPSVKARLGGLWDVQGINADLLSSGMQVDSLPLIASVNNAAAQMLFAQAFVYVPRFCRVVPIEQPNGCCTHVTVIDGNTNSLLVPAKEDPDCAAYFD